MRLPAFQFCPGSLGGLAGTGDLERKVSGSGHIELARNRGQAAVGLAAAKGELIMPGKHLTPPIGRHRRQITG